MRIRKLLMVTGAVLVLCIAVFALAAPTATACALVGFAGLESVTDANQTRVLVEPGTTSQDRTRFLALAAGARARIGRTFGAPRARPAIIFFRNPRLLWPITLSPFGVTMFAGSRACVAIGPQGQNVDVVAHELMHAELFERVGFWRRLTLIPVWFDEGIGMQVDYRPQFGVAKVQGIDTSYVRQLKSNGAFFVQDPEQLTRNFIAAKVEVARWLAGVRTSGLYQRLDRSRAGERFESRETTEENQNSTHSNTNH